MNFNSQIFNRIRRGYITARFFTNVGMRGKTLFFTCLLEWFNFNTHEAVCITTLSTWPEQRGDSYFVVHSWCGVRYNIFAQLNHFRLVKSVLLFLIFAQANMNPKALVWNEQRLQIVSRPGLLKHAQMAIVCHPTESGAGVGRGRCNIHIRLVILLTSNVHRIFIKIGKLKAGLTWKIITAGWKVQSCRFWKRDCGEWKKKWKMCSNLYLTE